MTRDAPGAATCAPALPDAATPAKDMPAGASPEGESPAPVSAAAVSPLGKLAGASPAVTRSAGAPPVPGSPAPVPAAAPSPSDKLAGASPEAALPPSAIPAPATSAGAQPASAAPAPAARAPASQPFAAPDYGRAFSAWRAAAGPAWHDYTHHAFVEGMRRGDLPRAAFLTYLVQDYRFLIHFSRAWALGVVKAATLDEMRACSATVHALVEGEMALHVGLCGAAGITPAALEAAEEAPENLAYTRYVLEAGYSGDFLDLLAALAPCVLGYGEIGLRLAATAAPDTPYRDWIETYAGDDYQQTCREVGALLDAALARRLGAAPEALPRWGELADRFATATRLEVAFWGLGRA